MPTTRKIIIFIMGALGLAYLVLFALVSFVKPTIVEIKQDVDFPKEQDQEQKMQSPVRDRAIFEQEEQFSQEAEAAS